MKLFIFSVLIFVGVADIASKELDAGPQTFTKSELNSSSTETPKPQKRYATKEIIMYLTPSQIKALNSGEAYITSQPSGQFGAESLEQQQEYLFNLKSRNEDIKKENDLLQIVKPIEEISKEEEPLQLQQKTFADNIRISDYISKELEQKKIFYPELEKDKALGRLLAEQEGKVELQSDSWIPLTLDKPETSLFKQSPLLQNPITEHKYFDQNALPILPINLEQITPLNKLRLPLKSSNLEIIKNIEESKSSLGLNYQHELERQKALAEIVAIANSLPVVAHSKISLKKRLPEPSFKHVLIPLPFVLKNPKLLSASQPKIPTLHPIPFFFSSADLDKLQH